MPLYEYQCQTCKRTLEKRQKFSDPELTDCPSCGGRLEKLISAPAVQFKGGGWFADGYGSSKGAAKSGSGGSTSSSDSSSNNSASSDSSAAPATPKASAPTNTASSPSTSSSPSK